MIFDKFRGEKFPTGELALIDLNIRMFIDPQVTLNAMKLAEYLNLVRAETASYFGQYDTIDKSVFASNQQFAALLEQQGVKVPMKVSPTTGKPMPALAKGDWAFKELCADLTQPLGVQALLATRLRVKSTIEETRAAALLALSQRDWGGKGAGWAPIPYKYYGAHCVPGDTEVLTLDGWVALEHWQGGTIAQVRPDQTIEFLPAQRFVGPETDQWIGVRAPYLRCDFTPGHTVPRLMQHHFTWNTIRAVELLSRSFIYTPLAGRLRAAGSITAEQMRVLAMVQADGHWEIDPAQGRGLAIFVKKPRKIERARVLLAAAGVPHREGVFDSQPGYVRFSVRQIDAPPWLTSDRKFFGAWLLDSTPEAREALMHELQHWDGWVQGNQVCYSSSDKVNVDWLATLAHLTGRCASIGVHERDEGRRTNYRIQLRQRSHGIVSQDHSESLTKMQRAYCATTQTGFFLARSHGRIFVTGNTGRFSGDGGVNFANLTRGSPIRGAIEAPPGHRIVHRDASQIEARMVAWLAGCRPLVKAFEEGRDIYSEFASLFYGRTVTKADKAERFCGKTAILSLGYGAGHVRFRHALFIGNGGISVRLTEAEALRLVRLYRDTFAAIPELWHRADQMLRAMMPGQNYQDFEPIPVIQYDPGVVWLPNGMSIQYPNLHWQMDATSGQSEIVYKAPRAGSKKIYGAKMTENITQALARIVVTNTMIRVYHTTGFRPFMSTYDSLDYLCPEDGAEAFDALLEREFAVVPEWTPGLPLASEGGFGRTLLEAEQGVNQ